MELKKIREMSEAELNAELLKMKKDHFNLRFQHVTGQLEKNLQRFRTNGKEDGLWQLKETEERQWSAWL